MRVLGIDPGYAIIGMGAVDFNANKYKTVKYGKIETSSKNTLSERLEEIFNLMNIWLKEIKPEAVAIEQLFFNTNTKTAISVAQARGVILLACRLYGVEVYEYTPLQVKQAVVGYGKAEKIQVQKMVKTMLNLEAIPKPDDVADALAVAICHTNNAGYNNIMKMLNDKVKKGGTI